MAAALSIVGPYAGKLNNEGETLALERPTAPDKNGAFGYLPVDVVSYDDQPPWPVQADGRGAALVRGVLSAFGESALNWRTGRVIDGTASLRRLLRDHAEVAPDAQVFQRETASISKRIFLPFILHQSLSLQANGCFSD